MSKPGPKPRPIEDRFWEKVDASGDCWEWTAATMKGDYGAFWDATATRAAHVVAWELLVGPMPVGLQLDHLCQNPLCVNPDHLEPVTPRENTHRSHGPTGVNARRTHCSKGHALTDENVRLRRTPHGWARQCRTCDKEYARVHNERKAAMTSTSGSSQ